MMINNDNVNDQTQKVVTKPKAQASNYLSIKNKDSILLELKKLKVQVNSCIALISQNKIDSVGLGSIKSVECQIVSSGTKLRSVEDKIKKSLIIKPTSSDV